MTQQPPQQPHTQLSQIVTQAVQNFQAQLDFKSTLKKGAKVPEVWVEEAGSKQPKRYPLLGDRYSLGRSSRSCDIVVRNPLVSQVHCTFERDKHNRRSFVVRDENSTNGIYFQQRRQQSLPLRHGDRLTLGPPELAAAVQLRYYNPPPLWVLLVRLGLYGMGGILGLLALWIAFEWSRVAVRPLPLGSTGPVVVYGGDRTPLNPQRQTPHRELPSLDVFSPYLPQAAIASEDSRFYWHFGVDPIGIARAVLINSQGGGIRQGASTLTQQVARSLFPEVGRENTIGRKLREILVALKLEAVYSKDELLQVYLNRIFLGVNNYGFEDAAQFYFDKSAADLDLSEAATLVAILPAPNSFNPVQDYDTALQLRNRVISRMLQLGTISEEEANRARRSRIEVSPKARRTFADAKAPYFFSHVFTELRELLGDDFAAEGNFIVETALDLKLQAQLEESLGEWVGTAGTSYGFSQGAVVTVNSKTGAILALVGGVDFQTSQFNRATQAKRQPGSTFKAIVYAAALAQGISPYEAFSCAPLSWGGKTYRACERTSGAADMFRGLAQSENAIALRIARRVGLGEVVEMAQNLGIGSQLQAVPGLAIGQSEVTVLEMTGAYTAFANQGIWQRPHAITRILDSSDCSDPENLQTCRAIYDYRQENPAGHQAIAPEVAKTMNRLLQGAVSSGTGRGAALGLGEGGKTGTTDRGVDLWFVGYLPKQEMVTGIWLGNDDNSPTRGSSAQAAALWKKYMQRVIN